MARGDNFNGSDPTHDITKDIQSLTPFRRRHSSDFMNASAWFPCPGLDSGGLGRNSSFDSKSDPIVRVEAARLRARLPSYYFGEGETAYW